MYKIIVNSMDRNLRNSQFSKELKCQQEHANSARNPYNEKETHFNSQYVKQIPQVECPPIMASQATPCMHAIKILSIYIYTIACMHGSGSYTVV